MREQVNILKAAPISLKATSYMGAARNGKPKAELLPSGDYQKYYEDMYSGK